MDKFSCRKSDLVITVGRDLVQTMKKRFGNKKPPKTIVINNWINEKEIYPLPPNHPKILEFKKKYGINKKFVIMYSGNIGLYYDLENIIKVIKKFRKGYTRTGVWQEGPKTKDGREVVFAFVGAGSVLDKLILYTQEHHFENIVFIPYQEKDKLIYSLNAGDVHWVVNAKGIKGISCPSKYYGIAAIQRPCLAVLDEGSEIRCIIEETGGGLCSKPGDYVAIEKNIQWFIENADNNEFLEMGRRGRENLINNLSQDISIQKYMKEIIKL